MSNLHLVYPADLVGQLKEALESEGFRVSGYDISLEQFLDAAEAGQIEKSSLILIEGTAGVSVNQKTVSAMHLAKIRAALPTSRIIVHLPVSFEKDLPYTTRIVQMGIYDIQFADEFDINTIRGWIDNTKTFADYPQLHGALHVDNDQDAKKSQQTTTFVEKTKSSGGLLGKLFPKKKADEPDQKQSSVALEKNSLAQADIVAIPAESPQTAVEYKEPIHEPTHAVVPSDGGHVAPAAAPPPNAGDDFDAVFGIASPTARAEKGSLPAQSATHDAAAKEERKSGTDIAKTAEPVTEKSDRVDSPTRDTTSETHVQTQPVASPQRALEAGTDSEKETALAVEKKEAAPAIQPQNRSEEVDERSPEPRPELLQSEADVEKDQVPQTPPPELTIKKKPQLRDEIMDYMGDADLLKPIEQPSFLGKSVTIGIAGAGPRTGSTYQTIQSGLFLAQMGFRVACIEKGVAEKISSFQSFRTDRNTEYGSGFQYHKVDFYPNCSPEQYLDILSSPYDYFVIDFGSLQHAEVHAEYLRSDLQLMMMGASTWDVHTFATTFHLLQQWKIRKPWHALVNFGSPKMFKEITEEITPKIQKQLNFTMHLNPYHPDPLTLSDQKQVMEQVFQQVLPRQPQRKRLFSR